MVYMVYLLHVFMIVPDAQAEIVESRCQDTGGYEHQKSNQGMRNEQSQ